MFQANKTNRAKTLESGEKAPNSASRQVKRAMPQKGPSLASAIRGQYVGPALGSAVLYDDGGLVNTDKSKEAKVDDDHQLAVLEDGERVLTPEQSAQYDKEHPEALVQTGTRPASAFGTATEGAPSDFAGPVFENPNGIEPRWDEAARNPVDKPSVDAEFTLANNKLVPSRTAPSSFGTAQATPEKNAADSAFARALKAHSDLVAANNQKTAEAANKGDLVTLGASLINKNFGLPVLEVPTQDASVSSDQLVPRDVTSEQSRGIPKVQSESTPFRATSPEEYKTNVNALKQRIFDAKLKGDQVAVGNAEDALIEYQRANPFGSAGNHPGILGKIEHGLSKAGQLAGDLVAPDLMSMVPGTALNQVVGERSALGRIKLGSEAALQAAEAHKALGGEWERGEPIYDTNPASDTYGQAIGQSFYNKINPSQTRDVMFGQTGAVATPQGQPAGATRSGNAPILSYGKPQTLSTPISPKEVEQTNKQAADLYRQLNPNAKEIPNEWQLPANASEKQLENFNKMLDKQIDTQKQLAQQAQNEQDKRDRLALLKAMQDLQRQGKELQIAQEQAKPAIGINEAGQKISGSFGDLKAAGAKNITLNAKAMDDVTYRNMAKMVTDTRDFLHILPSVKDDDLTAINRLAADFSIHALGTSIGGDYFNKMFNSEIYKDLEKRADKGDASAKSAIQLMNVYRMLSEDSIAYLTSIQQVRGMRGQGLVEKIESAYITPQKNRKGNVDAADRFLTTLHAAEHDLPMQPEDIPIDWSLR